MLFPVLTSWYSDTFIRRGGIITDTTKHVKISGGHILLCRETVAWLHTEHQDLICSHVQQTTSHHTVIGWQILKFDSQKQNKANTVTWRQTESQDEVRSHLKNSRENVIHVQLKLQPELKSITCSFQNYSLNYKWVTWLLFASPNWLIIGLRCEAKQTKHKNAAKIYVSALDQKTNTTSSFTL